MHEYSISALYSTVQYNIVYISIDQLTGID